MRRRAMMGGCYGAGMELVVVSKSGRAALEEVGYLSNYSSCFYNCCG